RGCVARRPPTRPRSSNQRSSSPRSRREPDTRWNTNWLDRVDVAMPAITVDNPIVLPKIAHPRDEAIVRPVERIVASHFAMEGAGFGVWRPFPGGLDLHLTDPFLLLDQLGPTINAPGEAKGAPWHPHRGFETVTYLLDGEIAHHDSNGGGGVIG